MRRLLTEIMVSACREFNIVYQEPHTESSGEVPPAVVSDDSELPASTPLTWFWTV
jgi:hypothetical protein